ncbi:hypothetical protein GUITHDRAFT_145466 [Guillardia theta CCMP2712]|uniref:Uncharacterized protein n=1 Tax=Guillardia theta (strain CCMP2712) TaxID=905079 RepID=L1IKU2_GUITC|nr:hypothetical protein GUITHDRAFT_145466 [Guillardia theta CCMP2712]EKX36846.1 hypothetical protein GUITHDRAFT_145466 [Guillardia theta CCMP2712]|eukprot:XP_005823826.1 hypothetical protein GUITHDRAFT_145466 [Guillardia theta CCMP2712]
MSHALLLILSCSSSLPSTLSFDDCVAIGQVSHLVATLDLTRSKTDSNKASNAIAQKLLQGWTLLGETCPQDGCLVPLMLDPKTSIKVLINATIECKISLVPGNQPRKALASCEDVRQSRELVALIEDTVRALQSIEEWSDSQKP